MAGNESSRNERNHEFISRRKFLASTGALTGGIIFVPRHVFAAAGVPNPSDVITIAGVGIGGVGHGQIKSISEQPGVKITALCDVDDAFAKKTYDMFPDTPHCRDYRELLDKYNDQFDAVYCGTPDHTHAVICMAAARKKKHLCCVKPLTRTIHEVRTLAAEVKQRGLMTQVTAAPRTSDGACRVAEIIAGGTIGEVRQVYCWSNRPLWPQGMLRPTNTDPVPQTLDWDLWIGPAPMRPFVDRWPDGHYALRQVEAGHPPFPAVYHPWNFRGWWDFGTGALGDMGCHHFNGVFAAMKFRYPTVIEATSTKVFEETAPLASIVSYDFPAREGLPPCRMTWLDGGLKPPRPEGLDRELPDESDLYIGEKGFILGSELIPRKGQNLTPPPQTLQRRRGTWPEWIEAIRTGKPAGCDFEWASYLTEATLLGNIAIRVGKRLEYDGTAMKFTNNGEADQFLRCDYRSGWKL